LGLAGVVVILLAAAFYIQQGRNAARAPDAVTAVLQTPDPQTDQAITLDSQAAKEGAVDEAAAKDVTAEAPKAMTAAPAFDEVRREPDGMTIIAGRGAPGSVVSVMQNGVEIATSTVDRSGKFATLALIPPDGRGHSLTLSQLIGETAQQSEGEILLAPLAAPSDTAEAAAVPVQGDSVKATTETASLADTSDAQAVGAAQEGALEATGQGGSTIDAEVASAAPDLQESVEATDPSQTLTDWTGPVAQTVASLEPNAAAPLKPSVPAALRSTAEGVELLTPAVPEAMDNVALDTISYSDEGDVQLAGRAQADATSVRVYLDNSAVVDLPVDGAGRWRGDVPDVDEGIYTLRVDEVLADGKVSSRVETPFKRESLEVLAAASDAQDGPVKAITVQKGATLWAIARERYGEGELYVRVFEANKETIRDPNLIYPGQIFELPQQ